MTRRSVLGGALVGTAAIATGLAFGSGSASATTVLKDFRFGTGPGRNVRSLTDLAASFKPHMVWGTEVINGEWQRYSTFVDKNHHFTPTSLDLTALADLGGVKPGGISSGLIASKDIFLPVVKATPGGPPGLFDLNVIFELRAKIPNKIGTWPAFWLYARDQPVTNSEIDIFEFFSSATTDAHDWTGFDHGPGIGPVIEDHRTSGEFWHPGTDFSAGYHTYKLVWGPSTIAKFVDDQLVFSRRFAWSGPAPQVVINLAIGHENRRVVQPPVAQTFPAVFSLDYLKISQEAVPHRG